MINWLWCWVFGHKPTKRSRDVWGHYFLTCPRCGHAEQVERMPYKPFRKGDAA